MSVPRYKARQLRGLDEQKYELFDVLDLAANGAVVLIDVPSRIVVDVVNAMNRAYETGVEDGTVSERIGRAGRLRTGEEG